MISQDTKRVIPTFPDEVEYLERAYLYGHYDSRGGAAMIIASDIMKAHQTYLDNFFPGMANLDDVLIDDFIGRFSVVVCGSPLPPAGELLKPYGAQPGYICYLAHKRRGVAHINAQGRPVPGELDIIVLSTSVQVQFQDYWLSAWDIGEDAFGLRLVRSWDHASL